MNLMDLGDSKFTACHIYENVLINGDVLALEANRLKAVGSSQRSVFVFSVQATNHTSKAKNPLITHSVTYSYDVLPYTEKERTNKTKMGLSSVRKKAPQMMDD